MLRSFLGCVRKCGGLCWEVCWVLLGSVEVSVRNCGGLC